MPSIYEKFVYRTSMNEAAPAPSEVSNGIRQLEEAGRVAAGIRWNAAGYLEDAVERMVEFLNAIGSGDVDSAALALREVRRAILSARNAWDRLGIPEARDTKQIVQRIDSYIRELEDEAGRDWLDTSEIVRYAVEDFLQWTLSHLAVIGMLASVKSKTRDLIKIAGSLKPTREDGKNERQAKSIFVRLIQNLVNFDVDENTADDLNRTWRFVSMVLPEFEEWLRKFYNMYRMLADVVSIEMQLGTKWFTDARVVGREIKSFTRALDDVVSSKRM